MRKVVDSNYLQSADLRIYLSRPNNFVVVTDYASMEAYKDNTLKSIHKSMCILCEFPERVIVLKGTKAIGALSGRRSHLAHRMIWAQQTQGFPVFCKHLKLAEDGNFSLRQQLLDHGRVATEQMDKVLRDAGTMIDIFGDMATAYTEDELRIFRTGGDYTPAMVRKVMNAVTGIAAESMKRHPSGIRPPSSRQDLLNTFLFRHALCAYLLHVRWIREGGQTNVRAEKVRNDLVDAIFCTYATFFDGLLTHDKKLASLHDESRAILRLLGVG